MYKSFLKNLKKKQGNDKGITESPRALLKDPNSIGLGALTARVANYWDLKKWNRESGLASTNQVNFLVIQKSRGRIQE